MIDWLWQSDYRLYFIQLIPGTFCEIEMLNHLLSSMLPSFQADSISKSYHRLVHGIILISKDGMGPIKDDMDPFKDGMGPFKDGMGPFKDGMGPFKDGMGPFKDGMGPFDAGYHIMILSVTRK